MRGRKEKVGEGVLLSTAELDGKGEWVSGLREIGRDEEGGGDGWDVADTRGMEGVERDGMGRAEGDIDVEEDEEEDDGMMRLFEFDD